MKRNYLSLLLFAFIITHLHAQKKKDLSGTNIDGYKAIWFELNQKYPHGDKYSGALGTYTAKHNPMAIYAEQVNKTFFVYGGTTGKDEKYLLCMAGVFDHNTKMVSRPVVVYDKKGVDDPHDNPSIQMDKDGYIWVFVSGRGTKRMGFKYKSEKPYDISRFKLITEEEMTYPQTVYQKGKGFFHFFTKYTGVRELYFETSPDGENWTDDQKLAGIVEEGAEKAGHYQTTGRFENTIATFFNRHPNGNVDKRTDLYYLQTKDFGQTWTTVDGQKMEIPLEKVAIPPRVVDYQSPGKNVYMKDMNFDEKGNPVCLYITSGGHEPGPDNDPRDWRVTYWNGAAWETSIICQSDHNYDMGSLYISATEWKVIGPTIDGPQKYGTGGEIVFWKSTDKGKTWTMEKQVTRDSPLNHSYMRRPLNAKDPFYYFWADGNPDKLSISQLYFGDSQGNVWQLPYTMKKDWAKPVKVKF
ncbi:BNR-4 repeat-containing protein [Flexithrix dorotheae]|uniref:BNR-4 repeat-containing protein n=1 Tax=Flexithrix dorotheae TaxID=70993 RepID=UPI000367BDD8|nr:BNR-4 repeat-containing protein [Flexithrix dorotheae]